MLRALASLQPNPRPKPRMRQQLLSDYAALKAKYDTPLKSASFCSLAASRCSPLVAHSESGPEVCGGENIFAGQLDTVASGQPGTGIGSLTTGYRCGGNASEIPKIEQFWQSQLNRVILSPATGLNAPARVLSSPQNNSVPHWARVINIRPLRRI